MLDVRIVDETPAGDWQQDLSDYRDVNGIRIPFAIRTSIAGQHPAELIVREVVLNPPMDETIFQMPRLRAD
jgi:hypothetical protein